MSWRRFHALVFAAAATAAPPAGADPFTDHFDALRDEAVRLRDDLVPPLSRDEEARREALERLIGAMDAASASLADDVGTAKIVAIAIVRSLLDDPLLPGLALELLAALETDLRDRVLRLASRIGALPEGDIRRKSLKALAKLRARLDQMDDAQADEDLKSAGKSLFRASAAADKLERTVAAAARKAGLPCFTPHATVTATLDGLPYDVDPYRVTWVSIRNCPASPNWEDLHSSVLTFYRVTDTSLGPLADERIVLSFGNTTGPLFFGPGTYGLAGPVSTGGGALYAKVGENTSYPTEGSVTITSFDLAGQHAAGTATFRTTNTFPGNAHEITIEFDVTCHELIDSCTSAK